MSKLHNATNIDASAARRRTAKKTTAKRVRAAPSLRAGRTVKPGARAFEVLSRNFTADSRVEQHRMFGSPCLKVAGRVSAALVNDQLIVKLPESRVDGWVTAGQGTRFEPMQGRKMKEWLSVPVAAKAQWVKLAKEAFQQVQGAQPGRPQSSDPAHETT